MEHQEQIVHEGVSFPVAILASIVALVAAVFVGGVLVYFVQSVSFSAKEVAFEKEINSLESKIADLERKEIPADVSVVSSGVEDLDLPVVVYGRPGLLNNTEEGRAEKAILEQKLVQPYIDYYNEDEIDLIALRILVPVEIGEAYSVLGIFGDGVMEEFLFGVREDEYGYWEPTCMGECEYSEAFSAKYPEIVGE